jgi:hypothetical protein
MFNGTTAPDGVRRHNLDYEFWLSYVARKHEIAVSRVRALNDLATYYDYFVGSLASFQKEEYPLSLLKSDQKELLRLLADYDRSVKIDWLPINYSFL